MFEVLMTVNLLLALAQTFYLGMQWERDRPKKPSPPKSGDDQTHE